MNPVKLLRTAVWLVTGIKELAPEGHKPPGSLVLSHWSEPGQTYDSSGLVTYHTGQTHYFINNEEVDLATYARVGLQRAPVNKNYHEVPRG